MKYKNNKTMKKLSLICAVAVIGFSACSKEEAIVPVKSTSTVDAEKMMNENSTNPEKQKPVSHFQQDEDEAKFFRCGTDVPIIKTPANYPQPGPPIVILPVGEIR